MYYKCEVSNNLVYYKSEVSNNLVYYKCEVSNSLQHIFVSKPSQSLHNELG